MSWPIVSLNEVADIQMGTAPPGKSYNETGDGTPMIAGAGDYGDINPNPKKWTTSPTRITKIGDLIVCIRATIGDLNWSDKEYCLGRGVAGIRAKENISDIQYLAHYVNSIKKDLKKLGTGSTFLAIRKDDLESFKIPLPPLKEQKRIAAILDKADAIRRKRQQAIDLTDQLLRSVFLDMFGDPVTNPKGWEIQKLKDIAKVQIGPFGTQLHKADYIENGIPLINPKHIVDGKVIPDDNLTITVQKHGDLQQYHLNVDDIIMGRRGEMGRCALITDREKNWLCGTGSLFIRPEKKGVFSEYLFTLLSSPAIKAQLESKSLGATMPNLNKGIVGNIDILVPTHEALSKYSKIRAKYDVLIENTKTFSDSSLFNSLTQQAFKGELNKQVEAA